MSSKVFLLSVHQISKEKRQKYRRYFFGSVILLGTAGSIYIRQWRDEHLDELPLASTSGIFYIGVQNGANGSGKLKSQRAQTATTHPNFSGIRMKRELNVLSLTVARAGLMGNLVPNAKSVKDELDSIRSWHQQKGFHGGLVLREITRPLFNPALRPFLDPFEGENDEVTEPLSTDDDTLTLSPEQLDQRECYYLYYEVRPDGKIVQQIFCRGTTLTADVFTCLNSTFFYDTELGVRLHRGFRNHAHRLVEDLEPLLSNHPRSTIEIAGHSLGGATAMIVAAKLKKRGYNVVRVTAIAAPRFIEDDANAIKTMTELLPDDTLRIEDDLDGIPFLPPIGYATVGHKLWLVNGKDGNHSARFIPYYSGTRISGEPEVAQYAPLFPWVDSFLVNGRFFETALVITKTHRTRSYVSRVQELIDEMKHLENQIETSK